MQRQDFLDPNTVEALPTQIRAQSACDLASARRGLGPCEVTITISSTGNFSVFGAAASHHCITF
jgi:hypothetical protein